jgi:hypothetical protein
MMFYLLSLNRSPPLHDFLALSCLHVTPNSPTCSAAFDCWSLSPSTTFLYGLLLHGLSKHNWAGRDHTWLDESPLPSLALSRVDAALARPFSSGPFVFPVQRRPRRNVRLQGTNSSAATYGLLSTNACETVL